MKLEPQHNNRQQKQRVHWSTTVSDSGQTEAGESREAEEGKSRDNSGNPVTTRLLFAAARRKSTYFWNLLTAAALSANTVARSIHPDIWERRRG